MPRLVNAVPKYSRDKSSGRAFVRIDSRKVYLGAFNSPESRKEYDRVLSVWTLNHRSLPTTVNLPSTPSGINPASSPEAHLLCGELALKFTAETQRIRVKNGVPTSEVSVVKQALAPWVDLFGETPVSDFGPKLFKTLREHFCQRGLARTTVNKFMSRIKQAIAWAVAEELVSGEVLHRLQAVKGIRKGTAQIKESGPVEPVPQHLIDAAMKKSSAPVRAMIELQLLTGMRPGEVVLMRPCDMDRRGEVWKYIPMEHKNEHHGLAREIAIGPRAQAILEPYLKGRPFQNFCFSPAEAERSRNQTKRETHMEDYKSPSRLARDQRRARRQGRWGDRYSVTTYRRAIERACDKAFPVPEELRPNTTVISPVGKAKLLKKWGPQRFQEHHARVLAHFQQYRWHPNQLRHNAGTTIQDTFDLTASQRVLGHQKPDTTRIYAKLRFEKAAEIMKAVG